MKAISMNSMTKKSIPPSRWKKSNLFLFIIFSFMLPYGLSYSQGVGISEISITPDGSSILELRSTLRGFLPPRLTTTERDAIGTPATGLFLYNSTTNRINYRNGTWIALVSASDDLSVLASSTSLQLSTLLSDETGSGVAVFATSPALTTPNIGVATGTSLSVTGALTAQATTNQLVLGTTTTTTLSAAAPVSSQVITFPDPGAPANVIYDVLTQTISGAKTFSALGTFNVGITSTGAAVNLNASSNFATNINTGTSSGAVTIGNSASTGITLDPGTGSTLSLGNILGATAVTIDAGTGASRFATTGVGTLAIGGATSTGALTFGESSGAGQVVNIGTGTGAGTINIGTGATGAKSINVGTGAVANTITIGNVTGATAVNINSGTGASTFATTGAGTLAIGGTASTGALTLGSSSGAQTVNIGTGAGISTINIANGGAASVVRIGDNTGATSGTTLIGGSTTINGAFNYGVDAGASDTYAITLSPAPTAYTIGMFIILDANTANTGAATLNVNGLGAITIVKRAATALANGDIGAGRSCLLVYNGTNFILMNPVVQ